MRRSVVLSLALVLLAAACGGGDEGGGAGLDDDEQAIADAIYDQLLAEVDPDSPFGNNEARCFSDGVVRDFGAAELIAVGLSAEAIAAGTEPADVALDDDQAEMMVDVMMECVDFKSAFTAEFENEGISGESAECLADGMGEDFVRALAMAEFRGDGADPIDDPELGAQMFSLVADCLSFEELSQLGS